MVSNPCKVVLASHKWKLPRDRFDDITWQPILQLGHIGYAKPYTGNNAIQSFNIFCPIQEALAQGGQPRARHDAASSLVGAQPS